MHMDVTFRCDCGVVLENMFAVPEPNFMAENHRDSTTEDWDEIECEECGKEHEVHFISSLMATDCYINQGETEVQYSMPYDLEEKYAQVNWYLNTTSHYEILQTHLANARIFLRIQVPEKALFSLHVMLHGHIVSAVEGYLAGTFIHEVTESEDLIRRLVESDPEFSKRKFTLKEIYQKKSQLKYTVAEYLKGLIFHDLRKVKPLYHSVLNHDFGDITWLFNDVIKRHDCVHRAGYTKDGEAIDVSARSLTLLIENIESISSEVEKSVEQCRT